MRYLILSNARFAFLAASRALFIALPLVVVARLVIVAS